MGEYFADEMISNYSEYMDQYNQTGQGLFNYIILNPTRELNSDIGDEIGVLDYGGEQNGQGCYEIYGHQLVGAGIWKGEPLTLFSFGHYSNCNSGGNQYPGFVPGNTIIIRVYKPAEDQYYDYDAQITWGNSQSSFEIVVNSIVGDVNGDGLLNVLDVVAVVDMILGYSPVDLIADLNNDGEVDVLDIIEMLYLILGRG